MVILGIETSCDETAAAVVQKNGNRVKILSNVVASSAKLQEKFGGIIPEQAAREQIKSIIPVIQESLQVSGYRVQDLYAIAVTYGPGLIGSLLVGVETAKTLSLVWGKPLIPVNHLLGHFYANWITEPLAIRSSLLAEKSASQKRTAKSEQPKFPCIGLLVSGGHTDLVLITDHNEYKYIAGTRDDAAGECFDKCARLLGLPYPGGPAISSFARKGDPRSFALPRPMIDSKNFEFSFSGLKTAVANLIQSSEFRVQNLAASIEQTIVDVLVTKTIKAAKKYQVKTILVAGGVAANQKLVSNLQCTIYNLQLKTKLHVPPPELCTDNAAMIATCALFNFHPQDPAKVQADPNLAL